MTRMMLAASSASGSWQYLFANTKQASASWTLFFLNRRQQNSNDQPICFVFFLIIKKYKKSMSKIVFVCLFFKLSALSLVKLRSSRIVKGAKVVKWRGIKRSRGICKDEVVFQGEEAIEWWKNGKRKVTETISNSARPFQAHSTGTQKTDTHKENKKKAFHKNVYQTFRYLLVLLRNQNSIERFKRECIKINRDASQMCLGFCFVRWRPYLIT